jgi:hypothetical protein
VLSDNPDLSYIDIKAIPHVTAAVKKFDSLRDEVFGDADGWAVFDGNKNCEGQIGWGTVLTEAGGYQVGDFAPYGKYFTAAVMEVRNQVLNDSSIQMPIPTAGMGLTEEQSLNNCMTQITSQLGAIYQKLYYPSLSYCYAYNPSVKSDLKAEFKSRNWWLPSCGEMLRVAYYYSRYVALGEDNSSGLNIFSKAIANKIMNPFTHNAYYYTSSEPNASSAFVVMTDKWQLTGGQKNNGRICRPICAF